MQNLTNCLIIASPDVHGPFLQSQWRATVSFQKKWLATYLIPPPKCEAKAIKYLVVDSIRSIFKMGALKNVAPFPRVARPKHNVSYIVQTPAINENEGEISGVYRVHDKLFRSLLDYSQYDQRLAIIHGDQKTTSYIRAIVATQLEAGETYDRKQWLVPVPAFFHIMLNFVQLIFRTFWDPLVLEDVQFFDRGQHIGKDRVKYHQALPLLRDAFNARIFAFLIDDLICAGDLPESSVDSKSISEVLKEIAPKVLEDKLSAIQNRIFSPQAWTGEYIDEQNSFIDVNFRSCCRYMVVISYLLMMVTAVQLGDYGVLRQIIPQLPLFFYGGKSSNYGPEMLYFAWLLHPDVSDPELATGILRSGLVRCTTAGSGWKAIDLALEHVNNAFALDIKNNKNSTRNTSVIFNRLSVVGPYTAANRVSLENTFHSSQSGQHSAVSTVNEVMEYACKLYRDGNTKRRVDESTATQAPFDAPDILHIGAELLANSKIDDFNAKIVRPARVSSQQDLPVLHDENGLIIESEEGQRLYGVVGEENDENEEW